MPAQAQIVFRPRLQTRTYTVQCSPDFSSWNTPTSTTTNDAGQQRTVTDLSAAGGAKFHRVLISNP